MTLPASQPIRLEEAIVLLSGLAKTCGDRVWQREFLDLAAACSSFARTRKESESGRIKERAQRLASAATLIGQATWADAARVVGAAVDAPEPVRSASEIEPPSPTEWRAPEIPTSNMTEFAVRPVAANHARERISSAGQRETSAITEPLVARAVGRAQPLVLIVDSDPESRRVLETYFRAAGFRVMAVDDGGPALMKVRDELPALVVTDLILPMVPGEVFILALRRSQPTASIPIMVVTAEPWRLGPEHEVEVVLAKPVNVTVVVEAAKRLLGATIGTDPLQVSRV